MKKWWYPVFVLLTFKALALQNTMSNSVPQETSSWNIKGIVWEMAKTFTLAIVIIIPIRMFLFQPFFVDGESMEPTLDDKEYLIIYEHGYKQVRLGNWVLLNPSKQFQRGDIAVFHPPVSDKKFYIKRIIALPGESLAVQGGQVVLYNAQHPEGETLPERYIAEGSALRDMPKVTLTEDEYFVMGDNRNFSSDSRVFGPVARDRLVGKAVVRVLPITRAAIL
jgi:signal peptidase I